MTTRLSILAVLVASILAFGASSAFASLSDEVSAGKAIAARVDAGTATCKNLSTTDFEHLGEYVMEGMLGSSAAHGTMNARMDAMMGAQNADRTHQALGRRYARCATSGTGARMIGATGMIGSSGGWGAMMGSDPSWMRNGAWRHMTRADWQRADGHMMGSGWMMTNSGSGWSTGAVIAVVLAGLALGGLIVFAALRHPWRRGPSQPSTG